jgi:ribulose-phosphate 3-epimerase
MKAERAIRLSASILSADLTRLGAEIAEAERAGVDAIHVDVMDGRFVPEITFGPVVVEAVRRVSTLPIDAHLMIVEPERHLAAMARAGATSITVHAEAATDLRALLAQMRALGVRTAVALNPPTPLGQVEPVLAEVDMVLLMTVTPGYAGQRFIASVLPKIRELRARAPSLEIQVDGGITEATAPQCVAAGATVLAAASAIFTGDGGIAASIRRLRAAASPART